MVYFWFEWRFSKTQLLPAVFQLFAENLLPDNFVVLSAGSQDKTSAAYRDDVKDALQTFAPKSLETNKLLLSQFLDKVHYKKVNNQTEEDFGALKVFIDELSVNLNLARNIVYYFSIPPFLYDVVAANLVKFGLKWQTDGWKRIIVEKPFGYSYETAIELDKKLHNGFHEDQIYRIDHYLGKRKRFKILWSPGFRMVFEPIWNRKYIFDDRIKITASEKLE